MQKFQILVIFSLFALGAAACGGAQVADPAVAPGPMPASGDFDGVFHSDFGRMELTREGQKIVGLYEGDAHHGRIEGSIEGRLLHFQWTQWDERVGGKQRASTGSGIFAYTVELEQAGSKTKEVHRLEGRWGYGTDTGPNRWNAYKLSKRSKKRLKPHEEEEGAMDADYGSSAGFQEDDEEATEEVEFGGGDEDEEEEDDSLDDLF